jgi:hypothetical protein
MLGITERRSEYNGDSFEEYKFIIWLNKLRIDNLIKQLRIDNWIKKLRIDNLIKRLRIDNWIAQIRIDNLI